jgi:hypothetical protein
LDWSLPLPFSFLAKALAGSSFSKDNSPIDGVGALFRFSSLTRRSVDSRDSSASMEFRFSKDRRFSMEFRFALAGLPVHQTQQGIL